MNIGQLARKLGLSTRTIRHYEQIGLLSPARRTSAGYRVYDEEDLVRLQQIRYLLQLDLPLKELGRILTDSLGHLKLPGRTRSSQENKPRVKGIQMARAQRNRQSGVQSRPVS